MGSSELDGTYQISTVTNYDGPLERKSDGITEIRDGRTSRTDDNKVVWTSDFTVINGKEIKMTSVADPTDAAGDFALTRPDGSPTREPVTYESILRYARKEDKVQMSGQIEYGNEIIFITMRKIGD
ncbi:MAG: hypothetical protein H6867_05220 [Rhodospirillales bacterium]|nr:hypothetical protein [Rhodospirillales bacterium]MCB9994929.1 hypothetical protein [Rhodospirillales bacterium]